MTWIVDVIDDPIEGDVIVELYRGGALVRAMLPLLGNWHRMLKERPVEWVAGVQSFGVMFDTFKVFEYIGGEWREMALVDNEGGVTWLWAN